MATSSDGYRILQKAMRIPVDTIGRSQSMLLPRIIEISRRHPQLEGRITECINIADMIHLQIVNIDKLYTYILNRKKFEYIDGHVGIVDLRPDEDYKKFMKLLHVINNVAVSEYETYYNNNYNNQELTDLTDYNLGTSLLIKQMFFYISNIIYCVDEDTPQYYAYDETLHDLPNYNCVRYTQLPDDYEKNDGRTFKGYSKDKNVIYLGMSTITENSNTVKYNIRTGQYEQLNDSEDVDEYNELANKCIDGIDFKLSTGENLDIFIRRLDYNIDESDDTKYTVLLDTVQLDGLMQMLINRGYLNYEQSGYFFTELEDVAGYALIGGGNRVVLIPTDKLYDVDPEDGPTVEDIMEDVVMYEVEYKIEPSRYNFVDGKLYFYTTIPSRDIVGRSTKSSIIYYRFNGESLSLEEVMRMDDVYFYVVMPISRDRFAFIDIRAKESPIKTSVLYVTDSNGNKLYKTDLITYEYDFEYDVSSSDGRYMLYDTQYFNTDGCLKYCSVLIDFNMRGAGGIAR